ncbi:flavohemo protein [Xylariomycetidae sp. FL2044]|nr:flavohemo protein [Xylariomycetidae sp. FL2044]
MATSASLTQTQIDIVKSTAPALKTHGSTITTLFYRNMLTAHPELNNIFNQTGQITGQQPRALAQAVFAYAQYVDDLAKLTAAVERIAHKHASLTVQPAQYQIVGKFLIEAVASVLGDACTPEIAEAWTAAYDALAHVFINREQQIYAAHRGWKDWRRFKIQHKERESAEITSFYLVPEDGAPLPPFLPGQYVSLRVSIPDMGCMQPRQYSLSDAPGGDCYRISVKKEAGKLVGTPGLVSNKLHDEYEEGDLVELTHPTGEFFVDAADRSTAPIVLISAGVGVTPMMSILNSLTKGHDSGPPGPRRISWIHGAHSSESRAFAGHLRKASEKNANIRCTIFLTETKEGEVEGVDYHFRGRVSLPKLDPEMSLFLGTRGTQYYVCGPSAFMADVRQFLLDAGVGPDGIHLEVFGVGNE